MSKRDQFEVIKPRNLPKIGAQHYTKDWPLQEELLLCKERNVINNPSSGQRQNTFPTAAHQARLNQAVHQGFGQGW